MPKVLITPRSFGKHSEEASRILTAHGFEVVTNPYGRIMTEEEMKKEIVDVDAVIVGVDPLNADVLAEAKRLKVISKYGVGTDNIDIDYCKANNIPVTITRNANADSVADFTFALMLAIARRIVEIDQSCRVMDWSKKTSIGIYGKTLGVIGTGAIGKGVIKRAHGFDMDILAYDVCPDNEFAKEYKVTYVDLEHLVKESDFITLHLPATPETNNLFSEKEFSMMKETAVLVNTARGELIDEDALYNVLRNKKIWGAGIDVFKKEPPEKKELLELDNMIIGSHAAASSVDAVNKMSLMAVENILANFK
ncbi:MULTISPECIES: phosphoglycerate dehydrogenase [Niallia]|jgi:phosphoglycerate dehydrogenase-like enzyme|uniref:Hydroxyacid dehydrogenase n=1 Tax=Niallia circulans TaxID=1397 RepID=A0A268FEN8_NIACI|nr:phosphoglycerate dehydrogenase [Niallia circulans]AYV68135.1 hydroxyacid dehydrogenase [Niallia circulans]NRG26003.1 phosphoglycerate dehydrogenase [Niallia circulans]PAD83835.1 hydroxyacid dehydrogenase [Niallia circulans]QJX64051.1 phosphoglycerate dehydrogenase [Niallia circulans]